MDKIKPFLEGLYRQRFWITCGLVAIASVVTWYMAWSAINKEREDRVTKLNSKKSSIENVISYGVDVGDGETVSVHPNKATQEAMDGQIDAAARGALAAWQERYDAQKEILQFAPELPQHIRERLAKHEPMEKPVEEEESTFRETFAEYIPRRMPALAAKVTTTWQFD